MSEFWQVKTRWQAEQFAQFIRDNVEAGKEYTYSIKEESRTSSQNRALHAVFRRLATALNEAGFGIAHPMKPALEIPYSEHTVKELLYRPIIEALYDKRSTTELSRQEMSHAMDILLGRVAEITGVVVDGMEGVHP